MNQVSSIWIDFGSDYINNSLKFKYNWMFGANGDKTKTPRIYRDYYRFALGIL